MALSLFQWIGIGLLVALVLIPAVRWFWKRFDMPSKFAIETMRQQKKDAAEARMWSSIEAKVQAEEDARQALEIRQREKQESAGNHSMLSNQQMFGISWGSTRQYNPSRELKLHLWY